jgi:hypothetical protein
MAKIAKKLTDTEIKSTKPTDKEINLFDGDGLILRIAPLSKGGKKNWYFRYAVPVSKKRTKMSLGTYTSHWQEQEPCEMNTFPCLRMV